MSTTSIDIHSLARLLASERERVCVSTHTWLAAATIWNEPPCRSESSNTVSSSKYPVYLTVEIHTQHHSFTHSVTHSLIQDQVRLLRVEIAIAILSTRSNL